MSIGGVGGVVDLGAVRERAAAAADPFRQHKWIMAANFAVDDETMVRLAAVRTQAASGVVMTEEETHVPIPMNTESLIGTDGPGCLKCGILWLSEEGFGAPCPVSDQTYLDRGAQITTPAPITPAAIPDAIPMPPSPARELTVVQNPLVVVERR